MKESASPMVQEPLTTFEGRLRAGAHVQDRVDMPSMEDVIRGMKRGALPVTLGVAALVAPSALAGGEAQPAPVVTNVTPEAPALSFSTSMVSLSNKERAVASTKGKALTDASGRTLVRFHMPRGLNRRQEAGCVDAPDGKEFTNSFVDSRGKTVRFLDHFQPGEEICTLPDGSTRLGNVNEDIECGNKIWLTPVRNVVPESSLHVVRSFKGFIRAKGDVAVVATAAIEGDASCKTANTSASAHIQGSGRAEAKATVEIAVKQKSASRLAVRGIRAAGVRALTQSGETTRISQSASADASVDLSGRAEVFCAEATQTPTSPEVVTNPPTVDLVDLQHMSVGGTAEVCAFGKDPDGQSDIVSRGFTESGDGNIISDVRPGNEAGEFCVDFAAGTSAGRAEITATVVDSKGRSASDTENWPIVNPQPGEPGAF